MNDLFGGDVEQLFMQLFRAKDEITVQGIIDERNQAFAPQNWKPLGDSKSNFSIVKNQQSNPVAAIIEKVTNAIDAILMKRALELGIDPKGPMAPQTMDAAVERFFPQSDWDLPKFRRQQALNIQIIADGEGPQKRRNHPTCVIVYDNGEGQHPEDFESTFLSLMQGNKNDIQFVQGKYNMGGSGALVFAGKRRFQLIGSKRFDGKGEFGFTLIREHRKTEDDRAKETWYEYWLPNGAVPSFHIDSLDLGLEERKFITGTILKLYDYQFPSGYSGFAQELNQSITEYLFEPALPVLTKDTELRYPNNKVNVLDLYGLKRRLIAEEKEYLEEKFSLDFNEAMIGPMKVTCFVFKNKLKDFDVKRSKEVIQDRYFKNEMSVQFSVNGQVHGSFGTGFITQALKMNMLRNHLLIHVDCTHMHYDFRKELFMASRDRMKEGDETKYLRVYLAKELSRKGGRLDEIQERRKSAADIDTSATTKDLLRSFANKMPLNPELMKMLQQTFKLDAKSDKKGQELKKDKPRDKEPKEHEPFKPQRFPTFLKLQGRNDGEHEVTKIPINGEKTLRLKTDVENDYFDRIEEPGDLRITVLNMRPNEATGGTGPGTPKDITDVFNVVKSSPKDGTIRITLSPKEEEVKVGDSVQIQVSLSAPGGPQEDIFWVKISEPDQPHEPKPKKEEAVEPLGLPDLVQVYKDKGERTDALSWADVELATGEAMIHETTMVPMTKGDEMEKIFVNMDSHALLDFRSKLKNPSPDAIELANRKYYTSVYFHALFLYMITKNRGYQIKRTKNDKEEPVDIGSYLKDLFDNSYSSFILTFGGTEELMQGLGD
jgi:hypothetical protein